MKKPTLVIMAAGMGSRFGGMKQVAPLGPHGEIILDYACFDALRAGYGRIIFVIKKENLALFREVAGDRIAEKVEVVYAFQEAKLPAGYLVPAGRQKPFGTGHAVLSAAPYIDGPFTVTNADDYYGPEAYRLMAAHLQTSSDSAMVGYDLLKTVTENGAVSRGVCSTGDGYLLQVTEKTRIVCTAEGVVSQEEDGVHPLSPDTVVSMNFWGFPETVLPAFSRSFTDYLENKLPRDPLKAEFYLPTAAQYLIDNRISRVKLLSSHDFWYGVTYPEDRETVSAALRRMHDEGLYPEKLF